MQHFPDHQSTVLTQLLEPLGRCLSPEVAQQIINLRADPDLQRHIDQLAEKNTEGMLSDAERSEYEAYVHAINFINILQIKARKLLKQQHSNV